MIDEKINPENSAKRKKIPTVLEIMKAAYAQSVTNVLSAETRLRNARAKQKIVNQAMRELGYDVK